MRVAVILAVAFLVAMGCLELSLWKRSGPAPTRAEVARKRELVAERTRCMQAASKETSPDLRGEILDRCGEIHAQLGGDPDAVRRPGGVIVAR